MPWARIDDGFLNHHKTERIPDRALGFWLRGLLYAARNLTNGNLPKSFARTKTHRGIADELERRGLWKATAGGWLIHDYLEWNLSKEEVLKRRREGKDRQSKWRAGNVVSNIVDNALVTGKDRYGKEGISSLLSPNGEISPQPNIPDEVRRENIRRLRDMTAEAAAKMAMPK